MNPGQSATSTVAITPTNGFNPSGVTFSCSIAPVVNPAPTCSVGAISVTNDTGNATLTVATTAASNVLAAGIASHSPGLLLALGLFIPAMLLGASGLAKDQQRKLLALGAVIVVFAGCLFQAACGGGSTSSNGGGPTGTPAGTYAITVTGSANGTQHTTQVSLTVK
jgi:hypothetical protein